MNISVLIIEKGIVAPNKIKKKEKIRNQNKNE